MKTVLTAAAAALALLGGTSAANAGIVFNFDSLATGTYTTASETESGLTASISTVSGTFNVSSTAGSVPGESGNGLTNFTGGAGDFLVNFSSAVSNVSIVGGDLGGDADNLFLSAYSGLNGTGLLIGTFNAAPCCSNTAGSTLLSVLGSGILSVKFNTQPTDAFPGSVYFDNLTVGDAGSAVPEPTSWALMIAGFGMAGAALRRRRLAVDA
jgi:hypothetical protein